VGLSLVGRTTTAAKFSLLATRSKVNCRAQTTPSGPDLREICPHHPVSGKPPPCPPVVRLWQRFPCGLNPQGDDFTVERLPIADVSALRTDQVWSARAPFLIAR